MNKDDKPIHDARDRLEQAVLQSNHETKETNAARHSENPRDISIDKQSSNEQAEIKEFLNDVSEENLIQVLIHEQTWAGLLPDPITFAKYPKDIQEKMIKWNDVKIINNSKRQDHFVNSYIKHCNRAQILNFILYLLPTIFSVIAFTITRDIACFSALSVPLVTTVLNVIKEYKNKDDSEK